MSTQAPSKPGVVITGGAGDLGSALAASFAADGFAVYAADIISVPERTGITDVIVDVTDRAAVFALAQRAARESRLQCWVNAAGIVAAGPIHAADPEVWDRVLAVNLTGSFHGCAAALAAMRDQGGRIVNVGSISGQIGGLGMHPAYGASKAGVHTLTRSYALEGAKSGVSCNAVAPSVITGSMADGLSPRQRGALIAQNPSRRLATMDEVVEAIRFLADEKRSSYINGIILPVNGGSYL